jgi:hypothetical protein
MLVCTTARRVAFPTSMFLRVRKDWISRFCWRKVRVANVVYKDAHCYGVWCSTNIIEIRGDPAKSVSYKLQTAIVYELNQLN